MVARLADLLIDAVIPPDQTALLERARDEIRKGTVQLSLRGYSHVFLHSADAGQPDTQSMRAPVEISTPAIAFQGGLRPHSLAPHCRSLCARARSDQRSVNQSMATSRGRCATPTRPQHGSLGPT